MKTRLSLVVLAIFLGNVSLFAQSKTKSDDRVSGTPRFTLININEVAMWVWADGFSARNPNGDSGVTFPRGVSSSLTMIFQDGLIWGGIVRDGNTPELRVGGQTYISGTVEGAIVSKGVAEDPNAADVRIWRIRKNYATADLTLDATELGETVATVRAQYAQDWAEWPWQKGAPWIGINDVQDGGYLGPDGTTILGAGNGTMDRGEDANSNGILDAGEDANNNGVLDGEFPGIAGADQVVWTVANDLNSEKTEGLYGSPPIGLEMQLTLWGYDRTDDLGHAIFKRCRLIYKGTSNTPENAMIDSMYIGQWSDPDVGAYSDDLVGVDSTRSLAYAYNGSSNDATYSGFGFPPPAAGYDLLQGPLVPSPGDIGAFNFAPRDGFRNLPMTSFGYFPAGASPPLGSETGTLQWWNQLRGFLPQSDPQNLQRYQNTETGDPTFFPLSGDPVAQSGDLDGNTFSPGDRRMQFASGPFTMAFGDTQEVIIAFTAGLGSSNLSSISRLRAADLAAQELYDSFTPFTTTVEETVPEIPGGFTLMQNYPNPFNPETRIQYQNPQSSHITLEVFDILGRKVKTLVDGIKQPGIHSVIWDGTNDLNNQVASGVYFYTLKADNRFAKSQKMIFLK